MKTCATIILLEFYRLLTPHPLRCAQHLFLPKRAPFVGFADISPARGGNTSRRRLLPTAQYYSNCVYVQGISIISVPVVSSAKPIRAFLDSRSWKTMAENATVTRMLSLSIGTTTLAGPSCSAL